MVSRLHRKHPAFRLPQIKHFLLPVPSLRSDRPLFLVIGLCHTRHSSIFLVLFRIRRIAADIHGRRLVVNMRLNRVVKLDLWRSIAQNLLQDTLVAQSSGGTHRFFAENTLAVDPEAWSTGRYVRVSLEELG